MKGLADNKGLLAIVIAGVCIGFNVQAQAQEKLGPVSVTVMPMRYISVKGDVAKFRALNWVNDGAEGGIKDLSFDQSLKNGLNVSLEGHSIPNENDNALDFKLGKGNAGYIKADYSSFRKYYDGTGGTYYPFSTYRVTTLGDDLKMDLEHVYVEIGSSSEDEPGVSASFGRHSKDGRKSRLAWTAVKEGAVTREIGPSWQDVNEATDTLSLKANTELGGVKLFGEQKFEFFHADSLREEKLLTTDAGLNANNKMRRQVQRPESDLFTTSLRGEKWFLNDKDFVSLGYRFSNMDASENEALTEYKADGTLFNYTSPKNRPGASANNSYNAHTLVGNFFSSLTDRFNFITKVKTEVLSKRASSTYPGDTNANAVPNGIINTTDVSDVENKIYRFGENFSLRYSGIPHTSLYTEVELEQTRNWLTEERNSIAGESAAEAGEQLARETVTHIQKTIWATGARFTPNKYFNATAQVRHKLEDNDFDDIFETTYVSGAKSAFFDDLKLKGDDVSIKFSLKPVKRVEGSFRYQMMDSRYFSRIENEVEQKARTLNNIFSYDLNLQPIDPLFLTFSFSKAYSNTTTPAASSLTSSQVPGINSNSNIWLASSSYEFNEKVSFTNSVVYSNMKNKNENTTVIFFGNDHRSYDFTTGLRLNIKKNFSVEPHYSYYAYRANQDVESDSSYSAHVVWLDAKFNW